MRLNTAVTLLAETLSALLGVGTAVFALWLKSGEARLQQVEQRSKEIEAKIQGLDERDKAEESKQLQQTHDLVNNALQEVSRARQSAIASSATDQPAAAEARKAVAEKLISELLSDDPATRHHGHFNLALLRQAAVKPMMAALQERENQQDASANRLRLGVD